MATRYIDYKVTDNGLVELSKERIRETEHNIHRLRIYADFEIGPTSPFLVDIVLTRADRLTIGPISMGLAQDESGAWHRYYDIKEVMTEITGPLYFGVAYREWGENEEGVIVLQKVYPIYKSLTYVYDTNRKTYERDYDIYARLRDLEGTAGSEIDKRLSLVESQLLEIENGVGAPILETLEEANASPKAKKAGSIAFIKI